MPPKERLWAPWRMEFIKGDKPKGCIFCHLPDVDRREKLIVFTGATATVMLNLYPYNSGHLMVAPKQHTADLSDLDEAESKDFFALIRDSASILNKELSPQGLNIGMNLGASAGAGVVDHLHMHIVPRWEGDTNFMPVLTDTRVVLEYLFETYDKLKPLFDKLSS